jgi:hypothetical protein
MSLEWALGVLILLLLVALVSFQLGRLSRPTGPAGRPHQKPSHPSVFVDMDDKPPGDRLRSRHPRQSAPQKPQPG